jgi:hypothetical protein
MLAEMAVIGAAVYALQGLSAPLTGWLCDRMIQINPGPDIGRPARLGPGAR